MGGGGRGGGSSLRSQESEQWPEEPVACSGRRYNVLMCGDPGRLKTRWSLQGPGEGGGVGRGA